MYKKIAIWISILCIQHIQAISPLQHLEAPIAEFTILITTYNNEQYCEANLASVAYQKSSKPYQIIIVNDCSADKTGELLEKFVHKHQLESKVTLIHNTKRCYSLENIYSTIHNYVEDHKIVVSVDGDDQLSSDQVLLRLEEEYKNPHIHLTYGSYIPSKGGKYKNYATKIPDEIIRKGGIRKSKLFKASHLKTFRAGLFKLIKKEDLMENGIFLQTTGDIAFMYPMIDMLASPEKDEPLHISFIPDILYLYNNDNSISVHKTNRKKAQYAKRKSISRLKPYNPIDTTLLKQSAIS